MIINVRGAGGSGKTELVRRILWDYGWRGGIAQASPLTAEPILRQERQRPIGYRLTHPSGGRSLVVLGHYEVTSGGCDTIRQRDGGLDEVFCLAHQQGAAGHDVIIEGLRLSSEVERTKELARLHRVHILRLTTPVEQCSRNLARRRRTGQKSLAAITASVLGEQARIEQACAVLERRADVEYVGFEQALVRVRTLLRLPLQAGPIANGRPS